MQIKLLVTFSLLLSMVTSISAGPSSIDLEINNVTTDLCASLEGRTLIITANGYKGSTTTPFSLSEGTDGSYTFKTTIQFENEKKGDELTGTCKNRHIIFKRIREGKGSFVQDYDGWVFEKGGYLRGMAGTFTHNGVKKWSWCGQIAVAGPK